MAEETTEPLVNKCPTGSIQSFPLGLGLSPNETTYALVADAIPPMDFIWATERSVIDPGGRSQTLLYWRNTKYTNYSTQLVAPTHNGWLVANKSNNRADFIMIFQTNSDTVSYRYIVLVIPLIEIDPSSTAAPEYLQRLQDPSRTGDYSLRTMFPEDSRAMFAYYTTCLKGYSDMASPEMVSVFVSVTGINVPGQILRDIKSARYGGSNNYPTFTPPFNTRLSTTQQTVGSSGMAFTDYIYSTTQLLNFQQAGREYVDASKAIREDTLDSYQCVPLDPDRNIEDGKIKVDLDTGEVLSDVIAERAAVRAADSTQGSMDPGRLEKYMGTAIGIVLAIIFFSIILYFMWNLLQKATGFSTLDGIAVPAAAVGVGAASAGISESWAQSLPKYVLLILVGGFGGFLIGAMLS
jgi:hypothetical protein